MSVCKPTVHCTVLQDDLCTAVLLLQWWWDGIQAIVHTSAGWWTHCLSYLSAESRVFLQPVSPDSAAARHIVQTLSLQYNTIMCVRWGTHFAAGVLGGERRLDCVNLLTECGCWVTVMVTLHTFACVSKYVLYHQWYIFEHYNYLCNAHGASRNPPHHLFTDGGPRRGPVTMIALLGKLFG